MGPRFLLLHSMTKVSNDLLFASAVLRSPLRPGATSPLFDPGHVGGRAPVGAEDLACFFLFVSMDNITIQIIKSKVMKCVNESFQKGTLVKIIAGKLWEHGAN
jgi:hypothetical protein